MNIISHEDVKTFKRDGFLLVKAVFPNEEIANLRARIQMLRQRALASKEYVADSAYPKATFIIGDLLGKRELKDLDYVILDERIIACAKQILGKQIVYFGDSSVQTGEGTRGFHKDNVDRSDPNGPDWQGEYNVIRFGIYLQDHARHSGGLKVRLRSHQYVSRHRGKAVNIPSEGGDVVIWNLRTSHSGNNVRFKGLPNLCLHPRLERFVPWFLRVPEEGERIALFCSFGAPGGHLDRYIQFQVTRGDYHEHWKRSGFDQDILDLAAARGVQIRKPIREYGSLYLGGREVAPFTA